jgi:hypothetical protein
MTEDRVEGWYSYASDSEFSEPTLAGPVTLNLTRELEIEDDEVLLRAVREKYAALITLGGAAEAENVLRNSADALHWVLDRLGVQVLEQLPGLRPVSGGFSVTPRR